jgi:hypothetical protein
MRATFSKHLTNFSIKETYLKQLGTCCAEVIEEVSCMTASRFNFRWAKIHGNRAEVVLGQLVSRDLAENLTNQSNYKMIN